jgi:hypothetical protein
MLAIPSNLVSNELRVTDSQRLQGQAYGDFPWRGDHIFGTAHFNNRLPDMEGYSQSLPKNFKSESSTLSTPTPE